MLLYASESGSRYQDWARETIAQAVSTEGVAINAVCLGETEPVTVADHIRGWGVEIFDVPAAAADICAAAYR